MDAYSSYNHICMHPTDEEKNSLHDCKGKLLLQDYAIWAQERRRKLSTTDGKVFHLQIRRSMEVYVDDMIVKAENMDLHVLNLVDTFYVVRPHNMCLNPEILFWD